MFEFSHSLRQVAAIGCLLAAIACVKDLSAQSPQGGLPWTGRLLDASGHPLRGAIIDINANGLDQTANTDAEGGFRLPSVSPGAYTLTVNVAGQTLRAPQRLDLSAQPRSAILTVSESNTLLVVLEDPQTARQGHGEQLSSSAVTEIPLNKRDFSALLLLSVGTSTDSNGTNFTPQFAINGQRGVEANFAIDGAETSDPEMGGSTFSNFNVDAIQAIDSSSGWMPAEIGRGASGYTNITTRSGTDRVHGSFFEFIRNSSLDARNYFDHPSPVSPGRIPPFRRNEFGLTNGGPVVIPHLYNGRSKTYYFVELQALRQVLGTTQVFPVPTLVRTIWPRQHRVPERPPPRARRSRHRKGPRPIPPPELRPGRLRRSHLRHLRQNHNQLRSALPPPRSRDRNEKSPLRACDLRQHHRPHD